MSRSSAVHRTVRLHSFCACIPVVLLPASLDGTLNQNHFLTHSMNLNPYGAPSRKGGSAAQDALAAGGRASVSGHLAERRETERQEAK